MVKFPYKLFFIVGRGRSGTTLLQFLLNAHPKLSVAPEALFIMNLYKENAHVKEWNREKLLSFYDDLWFEERLNDWHLQKENLRYDLLACRREVSFADLCKIVYANYATLQEKEDVSIFGDKNPHHCLFLKELISVFPDSKFIHFVRDYRDTILSYQKVKFDVHGTSALAYRWKKYNQEILKYSQRYPDQFILLRYEDLLAEPEHHLERICLFLGVDFTPGMLEFYRGVGNIDHLGGWHKNISRPLDKSRAYLWKSKMKKTHILKADYVCRDIFSSFGYENSSKQRSVMLFLLTLPGVFLGWVVTCLERFVFALPLRLRTKIIISYRSLTGSLTLKQD